MTLLRWLPVVFSVFFLGLPADARTPLLFTGSADSRIRVVTLNVWGLPDFDLKLKTVVPAPFLRQRIDRICRILRSRADDPAGWDVVLLQEVWTGRDREKLKNCGYDFHVDLEMDHRPAIEILNEASDKSLGLPLYSTPADRVLMEMILPDKFLEKEADSAFDSGLMILSRYPLVDAVRKTYRDIPGSFAGGDGIIRKGALFARVVGHPAGDFLVGNTHLVSSYDDRNDDLLKYRDKQFKSFAMRAKRYRNRHRRPMIVGGDLNVGPGSPIWPMVGERLPGYSAAPEADDVRSTYRPWSDDPKVTIRHIDHVLGSSDLEPERGAIVFDGVHGYDVGDGFMAFGRVSDHVGWETVFRIDI